MPHFVFLIDIREGYSTLFDIFINSYLLLEGPPPGILSLVGRHQRLGPLGGAKIAIYANETRHI